MDDTIAAKSLAALGHDVRLKVYRLLVRAGPQGLNIGEIGRLMALPPSTLSHHLGALVAAGLVVQDRRGREVVNRADYEKLRATILFVEAECCMGVETTGEAAARGAAIAAETEGERDERTGP